MSALLDMLVRRRRATAAIRLGPPSLNGHHREGVPDPMEVAAPDVEVAAPAMEVAAPDVEVAAPEPKVSPSEGEVPTPRGRSQMRRRLRYLRALREVQLRDIGGFLVECYRFKRPRPDLAEAKLKEAVQTDRELRALERALGEEHPLDEVRQPGIGGSCPDCGSVFGGTDRFCSWCGRRL